MSTYDLIMNKDINKTETKYSLDYSFKNYKYIRIRVDHTNYIKASENYRTSWLGQIAILIYSSGVPYYVIVRFVENEAVQAFVDRAVSGTAEFSGTAKLLIFGFNA